MSDSTAWVVRNIILLLIVAVVWFFVASSDLPSGLKIALDLLVLGPLAVSVGGLPRSSEEELRREEEIQRALRAQDSED